MESPTTLVVSVISQTADSLGSAFQVTLNIWETCGLCVQLTPLFLFLRWSSYIVLTYLELAM